MTDEEYEIVITNDNRVEKRTFSLSFQQAMKNISRRIMEREDAEIFKILDRIATSGFK